MDGGYIYVLTNQSFPGYVKIGYADNVDERVKQLNRSECTPFAFRKYAALHVEKRLADKNIHKIIDTFKPELRSKDTVNGKMRVREFFAMTPQEAVDLLTAIGSIYGEVPQIFDQTADEKTEQKSAKEIAAEAEKKSPFSFYACGIKNGEQIVYIHDESIVCKVAGDNEVRYKFKKLSLNDFAENLLNGKNSFPCTLHFSYKGEALYALRKRLEDEKKYAPKGDSAAAEKHKVIGKNEILFFEMGDVKAKCTYQDGGYLLLKGSQIAPTLSKSCKDSIVKMREEYASAISKSHTLRKDIFFESHSAISMFVSGKNVNGKLHWKNKDGALLRDLLPEKDG